LKTDLYKIRCIHKSVDIQIIRYLQWRASVELIERKCTRYETPRGQVNRK